ncbi:MAG: class I tRNA ligase family protein, partial [Acutalibacteraceae bacterium]
PDDIVNEYGADTMRLYETFIGDFEKAAPWNSSSIKGCRRFVERYWNLQDIVSDETGYREKLETSFHKTIKKVTEDIDNLKANTAIAALMSLLNEIYDTGSVTKDELKTFTLLLNPFAPHVTEETWEVMNFGGVVTDHKWPEYDEEKCKENSIEIVAQVNGKLRAKLVVPADITADDAVAAAKADEKVAQSIEGKTIVKELYVKGRLVNIVVK